LLAADSGSVDAHYEYDTYGGSVIASGSAAAENAYRFSTKYRDKETGLYYYGYRYYDPAAGRWESRDPIGPGGGLNLYGFVENQPVAYIDAQGLRAEIPWDDFKEAFLKEHPDLTPTQRDWVVKQLSRGCVGLTCALTGKNEDLSDCWRSHVLALKRQKELREAWFGGCKNCVIFSVHFWNETGRDKRNPDARYYSEVESA
jgi:RHS repeat-associated protein